MSNFLTVNSAAKVLPSANPSPELPLNLGLSYPHLLLGQFPCLQSCLLSTPPLSTVVPFIFLNCSYGHITLLFKTFHHLPSNKLQFKLKPNILMLLKKPCISHLLFLSHLLPFCTFHLYLNVDSSLTGALLLCVDFCSCSFLDPKYFSSSFCPLPVNTLS